MFLSESLTLINCSTVWAARRMGYLKGAYRRCIEVYRVRHYGLGFLEIRGIFGGPYKKDDRV